MPKKEITKASPQKKGISLLELTAMVLRLSDRVGSLEKLIQEKFVRAYEPAHKEEAPAEKPAVPAEEEPKIEYPIPLDYRNLIATVLNRRFGITMEPLADQPAFMFTIVVPEEYSSLTVQEKEMMKADLRSKVISYAEGVNGVRAWAEMVYTSFNPELRAKIIADRI